MKELLSKYGFKSDGTCQCDGHHTEKYKKDEFEVRIRTRSNLFKIKHGGRSMTQWVPTNKLQESLQNLSVNVAI